MMNVVVTFLVLTRSLTELHFQHFYFFFSIFFISFLLKFLNSVNLIFDLLNVESKTGFYSLRLLILSNDNGNAVMTSLHMSPF